MDEFSGEFHILISSDILCSDNKKDQLRYPLELLNMIDAGILPPHQLSIKVGCPIMLMRILDATKGLCDGTHLICRSTSQRVILAEIATGRNISDLVSIPESNEEQLGIHFCRTQFPIRPAFAMTINKAQGQTFDFVGFCLPSPVFSHCQLYVALSRAQTPTSMEVLISHPTTIPHSTNNLVYKEVL